MDTTRPAAGITPARVVRRVGTTLPENTAMVGKGSGWVSPFNAGETKVFRNSDDARVVFSPSSTEEALDLFRWFLNDQPGLKEKVVAELGGKNLACWCSLDQQCHADVLLEVANGRRPSEDAPVRCWPMLKEGEGVVFASPSALSRMRGSGDPASWVEGRESPIGLDRNEIG